MKRMSKTTGLALAAAAATLLASGCSSLCGGVVHEAMVKCAGTNACKGSSQCATPSSSCKGENSCKGTGWLYMSKSECVSRGGKVVD